MSQLRTTSGIGAYESRAIDTIRRMLEEGSLPWGETCAVSGQPTPGCLQLQVKLEPDDGWRDRMGSWLLVAYMVGPLLAILFAILSKPFAARDPENVATVPLRVDRRFHRGLAWWGTQWKLRRLLSTVPIYARLLEEHPRAMIRVDWAATRHVARSPESRASTA